MPVLRIVVAEDDPAIRDLLVHHLTREGYRALPAADGPAALRAVRTGADIAIVDVGLPAIDGFEVVRTLRAEGRTQPVLIVSARGGETDRVVGLELGADDYVPKPFSPREVVARVRALARRSGLPPPEARAILRFGRLEVDEAAREARVDGTPVALKPREFALLHQLASNPGVALTRAALLASVWGYDFDGDERTVDVHVRRLRAKLEEGAGLPPLLAFRLPALERTAWREGRRAARALEGAASAAFGVAAARVLRAGDRVAHDRGSDGFLAALLAPVRSGAAEPAPLDVRSALARMAATVEGLTRLDVDAGWTRFEPGESGGVAAAAQRALERGAAERERYAFFSALGHELRTPLASIRGYLETLRDDAVEACARRRFVRIAHAESIRLGRLLDGMFEISVLDLAATFPQRGSCALDLALGGARDACAATAAARGVRLGLGAATGAVVAIDGDRLMLVLINRVDNAIKHGRRGGRVELAAAFGDSRSIVVTVDDDGAGIEPGERERIFTLGARGATGALGSGIGLALVRMILERAGGRIDAGESPLGGARFRATLPRRTEEGGVPA